MGWTGTLSQSVREVLSRDYTFSASARRVHEPPGHDGNDVHYVMRTERDRRMYPNGFGVVRQFPVRRTRREALADAAQHIAHI